jgi:hypothetical protein
MDEADAAADNECALSLVLGHSQVPMSAQTRRRLQGVDAAEDQ